MTTETILAKLDDSRNWFLKLLDGFGPEHWDAKPYPTVKSVKETLAHLVIADRCCQDMFQGKEPDYAALTPDPALTSDQLLTLLAKTHEEKKGFLRSHLDGKDLMQEIETVYSGKQPLWWEVLSYTTEDWYHIGQVSLLRQGLQPEWDYYAHFYAG
jgi:uncharacterized damage-inducible protein DinB